MYDSGRMGWAIGPAGKQGGRQAGRQQNTQGERQVLVSKHPTRFSNPERHRINTEADRCAIIQTPNQHPISTRPPARLPAHPPTVVLAELRGPQAAHILHALHRAAVHVRAKLLQRAKGQRQVGQQSKSWQASRDTQVSGGQGGNRQQAFTPTLNNPNPQPAVLSSTKADLVAVHGQALLQGQLEPVAAGDAVAGVVVEVLVPHHACTEGRVQLSSAQFSSVHQLRLPRKPAPLTVAS